VADVPGDGGGVEGCAAMWMQFITVGRAEPLPGQRQHWVRWHENGVDRRVPLRPVKEGEQRCLETHDDAVCLRRFEHPGGHVPLARKWAESAHILEP
jgi:hypothetical protein